MNDLPVPLGTIYNQGATVMRSIRSPLAAEIWASGLLGLVRLAMPTVTPAERDEAVGAFAVVFAEVAEGKDNTTGLAVIRAIAALSKPAVRTHLDQAAQRMVNTGIKDRSWAAVVGHPTVGRCLQHRDVETHQQTVIAEFGYGPSRHAVTVLIDHDLGGGIKDTWVAEDADEIFAKVRGNVPPGLVVEALEWPQARQLWTTALTCPDCPMDDDQLEDVPMNRAILQARLALNGPTEAGTAAVGKPHLSLVGADPRPAKSSPRSSR